MNRTTATTRTTNTKQKQPMFENFSFGNRTSPGPGPVGPHAVPAVRFTNINNINNIKKPQVQVQGQGQVQYSSSSSKRVAFSSNDQVRVFEPDLLHDDEAFMYTAKEFLRVIKADIRKKKGSRWFTSSTSSSTGAGAGTRSTNNNSTRSTDTSIHSDSGSEMDEGTMDKFRQAFEYRLKDLPEVKNAKFGKVDDLIRELVRVIHLAGWPSANGNVNVINDENEMSMHGHHGHSHVGYTGPNNNTYLRKSNVMMNEIESLQQRIRFKLTANRSVETVLGEMRHLSEVSRSTMVREVKDFCMREIKVMEYILEDMGYTLASHPMGM